MGSRGVGAPYEYVEVDVMHGQGREPWFLKINPGGKVPVLAGAGGYKFVIAKPKKKEPKPEEPIDPNVRIGHVHLRTADIDRVRDFYVGILGFDVVHEARGVPGWETTGDILFVSAGGYHHHLGLNTWESQGGSPRPREPPASTTSRSSTPPAPSSTTPSAA